MPDVTEEWKWKGTPTWSRSGLLCICNAFKEMVKVTFLNGAKLGMDDLFNAELGGNQWRAIKYFEGDKVNARALAKLLLAALALNETKGTGAGQKKSAAATTTSGKAAAKAPKSRAAATAKPKAAATAKPKAAAAVKPKAAATAKPRTAAAPKRAGARGVTPNR